MWVWPKALWGGNWGVYEWLFHLKLGSCKKMAVAEAMDGVA